jgi:hypothetical protein
MPVVPDGAHGLAAGLSVELRQDVGVPRVTRGLFDHVVQDPTGVLLLTVAHRPESKPWAPVDDGTALGACLAIESDDLLGVSWGSTRQSASGSASPRGVVRLSSREDHLELPISTPARCLTIPSRAVCERNDPRPKSLLRSAFDLSEDRRAVPLQILVKSSRSVPLVFGYCSSITGRPL